MEYLTPKEILEKIKDYKRAIKEEIENNNVSGMSKEYLIEKFAEWLDAETNERR